MKKISKKNILKQIKQLKFESLKKRIMICMVISLFSMIFIYFLNNSLNNKIDNYDYSMVEEKSGIITKAYKSKVYDRSARKFKTFAYIDVKLESGDTVTISLGNKLKHRKGEEITIYTNGEDYEITKYGVALDENYGLLYIIIMTLIGICTMYVWIYLFGIKGFFIFILLFLVIYSIFFE